jgi:hypothetical protein
VENTALLIEAGIDNRITHRYMVTPFMARKSGIQPLQTTHVEYSHLRPAVIEKTGMTDRFLFSGGKTCIGTENSVPRWIPYVHKSRNDKNVTHGAMHQPLNFSLNITHTN